MALVLSDGILIFVRPAQTAARGSVRIEGAHITEVGDVTVNDGDEVVDLGGAFVLPGLVQPHIHLCQTLFRNRADDLELLDWLQQKIWPFEAAHDDASNYASARLGIAELLSGGTTTILDMGTVHHTDAVFRAAEEMGIRATIGKCIMDRDDPSIPTGLRESAEHALAESEQLASQWHGAAEGRLRYAYAPRFVVSCTPESLRGSAERAKELGTPVHTHASENRGELELVRELTGKGNIEYLEEMGVLDSKAAIAHCVHVDDADMDRIRDADASVVHCPSSNLKLASGIAPVPRMLERGVRVAIGADGAPCNNNLDGFLELRLAALIHKPGAGPRAVPAWQALEMATIRGAEALGLDAEIGSIEVGKRADLAILDMSALHTTGGDDPVSRVVYSARASDVVSVLVDGRFVKKDRRLLVADEDEIRAKAHEGYEALLRRMQ